MASLGHIAVGLAAARVQHGDARRLGWAEMAGWSALSMLPDADVIGFPLGVRYADPWGHRGATHSVAFAVAVAAMVGLAARGLKRRSADDRAAAGRAEPWLRMWLIATVVLVSHGLLDTLTDGGLGIALLWPFDLTRYFAPWQPIPVSPIGLAFFSPYGFFVAMTELALFAPLLVYGLRARRMSTIGLCAWAGAVWLIGSRDPVRQSVLGRVLREHTEYAAGFSEAAFAAVRIGQSETEVRRQLGAPFGEYWEYISAEDAGDRGAEIVCPFVYLEADTVVVLPRDLGPATRLCERAGVKAGTLRAEVERLLGSPRQVCATYTRGTPRRYHRARVICFSGGKVDAVLSGWQPG